MILQLRCYRELKESRRLYKAIGSLGGGNHFIELDKDESGLFYLVVHTGSRNLGKQVAEIYQQLAVKSQSGWDKLMEEKKRIIEGYKQFGRRNEYRKLSETYTTHSGHVNAPFHKIHAMCREGLEKIVCMICVSVSVGHKLTAG